jgi:phage terminase large subunit
MTTNRHGASFQASVRALPLQGGLWRQRGGKSHHLVEQMVKRCMFNPGMRAVCIREIRRTLAQSSKCLIEDKIQALGVGSHFHVFHDRSETPGAGVIPFHGMQDSNAESIKSLEASTVAWIEEAQTLSHRSLAVLRPTIRAKGSEIWADWIRVGQINRRVRRGSAATVGPAAVMRTGGGVGCRWGY